MQLMAVLLEQSITLKLPSLKIVTGIALVALLLWKIFASSGQKAMSALRKMLLMIFIFFSIFPYFYLTGIIKEKLLIDYDLNSVLSEIFQQNKGTDWADGIISAFFTFLFIYYNLLLWKLNAKLDKAPPEEKPIKIEARIGNIGKGDEQK